MQFKGAYDMLKESEKMNIIPTANLYNAIMAGYFREVPYCSVLSSVVSVFSVSRIQEFPLHVFVLLFTFDDVML